MPLKYKCCRHTLNVRIRIVNKHRNVADKLGWEPRRKYAAATFSIESHALETVSMGLTRPMLSLILILLTMIPVTISMKMRAIFLENDEWEYVCGKHRLRCTKLAVIISFYFHNRFIIREIAYEDRVI